LWRFTEVAVETRAAILKRILHDKYGGIKRSSHRMDSIVLYTHSVQTSMMRNLSISNIKRAIQNPILIKRELYRLASIPIHYTYSQYLNYSLSQPMNVMDEDWDNLIILDACRPDYFQKQCSISGRLEQKISPGKRSWEFMRESFSGRELHDTIYITSNPHSKKLPDDTFFETDYLIDQWNDDIGTILPNDVVAAAIDAHREHPDKRLIIHFMQPHRPYLGPTADRLREQVDLIGYRNQGDGLQIWGAVKERKVTRDDIKKAYSETLDIVLKSVEELLTDVDGKTVITSDHGEMLGERVTPFTSRVWGHSEGFDTKILRTVPWFVIDSDQRRNTVADSPIGDDQQLKEKAVMDRLEALGYAEE